MTGIALLLAVCIGIAAPAAREPPQGPGQRVIRVEIGSSAMERGGLLDTFISTADDRDAAAAEQGLATALESRRWLRLVSGQAEVAVAVNRTRRTQSSRSTSRDGKRVTLGFRYAVGGIVATSTQRGRIEAEVTTSHSYDAGRTNMYPTRSQDRDAFERAGKELGSKARDWILPRIAGLRPDGPDAGFRHKPRTRWLIRGDGLEVTEVTPGGAAERAGLRVGDRIRRIDDLDGTSEMDERVYTLCLEGPGTRVMLEVERDRARRTVDIELAAPPARR